MSDCFISYRRVPSAALALLVQEKLKNQHGIDAYVDTTRTDSTKVQFPERLMRAVEDTPVFVCLLSSRDGQHTLESEWVLKEITRAYELRKFCVPVFQQDYVPIDVDSEAVSYMLNYDGVHVFDQSNVMIDASVAQLARLIVPNPQKDGRFPMVFFVSFAVFAFVAALVLIFTLSQNPSLNPPDTAAVDRDPTHTQDMLIVADEDVTFTPASALRATPTHSSDEIRALTPAASNTEWSVVERSFDSVPMVLVPAGNFVMGSTTDERATAVEICETAQRLETAAECASWMFSDETPTSKSIKPFWIDKHEVSVRVYKRFHEDAFSEPFVSDDDRICDGWTERENLPYFCATFEEATAICEARGARLPTEAEWEYAARGPDRPIFPWGDEIEGNEANSCDTNCSENAISKEFDYKNPDIDDFVVYHANVDAYDIGQSWVGALNMSGNVWEWTSTLASASEKSYIQRGGSWRSATFRLRAAERRAVPAGVPDFEFDVYGFRCVRDFE